MTYDEYARLAALQFLGEPKRAPKEVRCVWLYQRERTKLTQGLKNVYTCAACKSWTANMPLYRFTVCPAKDRRSANGDRRARR